MRGKTLLQNKRTWLTSAALTLVMSMSVGSTLAYFTAHTEAEGRYAVRIGIPDTEISEELDGLNKHIAIVNNGDTECYVRLRLLYGSLTDVAVAGEGWSQSEDGCWYYAQPLAAGAETAELIAEVTTDEDTPKDFEIIVIQESTPAVFEGANGPEYPGWNRIGDTEIGYTEEGE